MHVGIKTNLNVTRQKPSCNHTTSLSVATRGQSGRGGGGGDLIQ